MKSSVRSRGGAETAPASAVSAAILTIDIHRLRKPLMYADLNLKGHMMARVQHFKKPRVIDLFAGAGLFGSAFSNSGFELSCAVEIDKPAASTNAKNLGNHVVCGDIQKINPTATAEVIIAGPPCQGFSTLGRRDTRDPRNNLSLLILKWVNAIRPLVVVIENVPEFIDTPVWQKLTRNLKAAGYITDSVILNSADFGVAQHRTRSFTFASLSSVPQPLRLGSDNRLSVREAWAGLPSRPNGRNFHYAPKPSELALSRMRMIPPKGDKRDILRLAPHLAPPSWKKIKNEATDVWGRLDPSKPSNTLRTCFLNPSKGRYIHPRQHRVISIREAARLHSIPDDWDFEGTPYQIARQIGNSVPPNLGKAIADSVLAVL